MKNYFKQKTWLMAIMFMIALGLSSAAVYYEFGFKSKIKNLNASAGDNVSGWAWNSNIGWISFNCTGETPACGGSDYGVNIDSATGNFSGYAWSPSVGWISFNRTDTGNPPGQPYQTGTYLADYDSTNGQVSGWAKILSLGDNGWIKLRKFSSDSGADYGLTINPATGDFSGWAWNANDSGGEGIGWISFNCGNDGSCGVSNYKVIADINQPAAILNMTAPNWNYIQASANALRANLQFDFVDPDAGSFGSAYQIIVTKADDTPVLDTGKCTGYNTPSPNCKIDNSICLENGATGCVNPGDCVCQYPLEAELNYGTGYKWSVKAWDNNDVALALTPYSTNPDTDNNDGVVSTFTTYKHKFPLPSAAWFPVNPSQGEEVKFTDLSQTYTTAAPTAAIPCQASICDWLWTVPAGATIDDSASSTPTIIFNTAGSNSLKLKVTDKVDGYYAEITIPISVNAELPKWIEVKPE